MQRRRPCYAATTVVTLLLTVQGCAGAGPAGTAPAESDMHAVTGTVTVYDGEAFAARDGDCAGGAGGYTDLASGAQVTLKNESGKVVGVGAFTDGTLTGRGGCKLPFEVPDVRSADFYQLTTASLSRAPRTVSAEELASASWEMELSVGDPEEAAMVSGADCLRRKDFAVTARGAALAGYTTHGYAAPTSRVTGELVISSSSAEDAAVVVGWTFEVWSALLGDYTAVRIAADKVDVPAGQSARLPIDKRADLLSSAFDYDPSRVRVVATISDASRPGTRAMCS